MFQRWNAEDDRNNEVLMTALYIHMHLSRTYVCVCMYVYFMERIHYERDAKFFDLKTF